MKQIKLTDNVDRMLSELSQARKKKNELINTKQNIVAELIIKEHKKECKQ